MIDELLPPEYDEIYLQTPPSELAKRRLRRCPTCGEELPFEEYQLVSRYCRKCIRNKRILRRYGLTAADYDELLKAQRGRCKICRAKPRKKTYLDVDHNHKTGQVRGLLCRKCNLTLARFGDDHKLFTKAAQYLKGTL